MSRNNKVNPDHYTMAGRLSADELARQRVRQGEQQLGGRRRRSKPVPPWIANEQTNSGNDTPEPATADADQSAESATGEAAVTEVAAPANDVAAPRRPAAAARKPSRPAPKAKATTRAGAKKTAAKKTAAKKMAAKKAAKPSRAVAKRKTVKRKTVKKAGARKVGARKAAKRRR